MTDTNEHIVQVVWAAIEARHLVERVSKAMALPEIKDSPALWSLLTSAFEGLQPASRMLAEAAAAVGHPQQELLKAA